MYRNSHDLWGGDTVNKSNDNAEIFFGADSGKVKNSGVNNLSRDTNKSNEEGLFMNGRTRRKIGDIWNKYIAVRDSYINPKHYLRFGTFTLGKIPADMEYWESVHDNHNKIIRGQLDIIRDYAKPIVKAYETLMDTKLLREALIPFKSPNHAAAAYDVGFGINDGNNLASTAQRFAAQYDTLYSKKDYSTDRIKQGTNAIRHTFWQGALSSKYGPKVARDVGDSHETRPYADVNIRVFDNKEDADVVTDLLNNKIGRRVGAQYPDIDRQELALRVLEEYWKSGLYSYEQMPDGKWYVTKRVIPDDVYYDLHERYKNLNKYGK